MNFMKILLVAVNAKYIHSNLGIYSLKAYAGQQMDRCRSIRWKYVCRTFTGEDPM